MDVADDMFLSNVDRLIESNVDLALTNSALEASLAAANAELQDFSDKTSLLDAEVNSAEAGSC